MTDFLLQRDVELNLRMALPEIRAAHGQPCPYCGEAMAFGTKRFPTRDHVKPKCHGGTLGRRNKLIVCNPCNHDKGHKRLREFAEWLTKRNDPRQSLVWPLVESRVERSKA